MLGCGPLSLPFQALIADGRCPPKSCLALALLSWVNYTHPTLITTSTSPPDLWIESPGSDQRDIDATTPTHTPPPPSYRARPEKALCTPWALSHCCLLSAASLNGSVGAEKSQVRALAGHVFELGFASTSQEPGPEPTSPLPASHKKSFLWIGKAAQILEHIYIKSS